MKDNITIVTGEIEVKDSFKLMSIRQLKISEKILKKRNIAKYVVQLQNAFKQQTLIGEPQKEYWFQNRTVI